MARVTSTREAEYLGMSGLTLGEGVQNSRAEDVCNPRGEGVCNPTKEGVCSPRGEGVCSPTGEAVGGVRGDIALIQSKLKERLAEGRDRSSRLGREVSYRAGKLNCTAFNHIWLNNFINQSYPQ